MRQIFITLFLLPFTLFAQQNKVDSLKIEFNKATQDTTKARLLSEIGVAAYYINSDVAKKHNDTLIEFSKGVSDKYLAQGYRMKGVFFLLENDFKNAELWYLKALDIAKKANDKRAEAGYLANLGGLFARQNIYKKAIEYYILSITINKEIKNYTNILQVYSNLSITLSADNQILRSTEYLIEALEIAEDINSNQLHFLHKDLGRNYMALSQYEKAKPHLLKSLELLGEDGDPFSLGVIHESLSLLYDFGFDDYEKSLNHAQQSLHYYSIVNSTANILKAHYAIGQQNFQLKMLNNVVEHYLKGLEIAQSITEKDNDLKIKGNYYLAEFYAYQGNTRKADEYISEADKLLGNTSRMKYNKSYYKIGNAYAKSKSYKTAFENMQSYAVLSDSLHKIEGVEKIAELETKYQSEKKEKENLQLKADNIEQEQLTQKANSQKTMLALGLLASLLTLGVFIFFYRKNKKQKVIIENLQKELHHRVKNNLSIIDTFIEVAKEEFSDSKFQTKLTELQNRIDSINEVHQQLYQNKDVTNLNLKKYIERLAQNITMSFSNSNIELNNFIDNDLKIHADKSFPVGLIVNEFLTNSYKYAFHDNCNGKIHIDIKEHKNQYELSLSDNGKGLPQDFDISKTESFGMRIMKLLTEQLNGTFQLSNNDSGVSLHITFPKS